MTALLLLSTPELLFCGAVVVVYALGLCTDKHRDL